MGKVPAYVRVGLVARLCRMTTKDVRSMLAGMLVRHTGRPWWVPTDRLRDAFPDAYTALYDYFEEAERSRGRI